MQAQRVNYQEQAISSNTLGKNHAREQRQSKGANQASTCR